MSDSAQQQPRVATTPIPRANPGPLPAGPLKQLPFLTFVLPFAVYMLLGVLEPTPSKPGGAFGISIGYEHYPIVYTVKIVATLAAMAVVLPGYRTFPFRLTWLGPAVGILGIVAWVGLCSMDLEPRAYAASGLKWMVETGYSMLGLELPENQGERPAFNPLEVLADQPLWAYTFLAIRFLGLAFVVPVIEEFLLRGFLMRFVLSRDWWLVPFGTITGAALFYGTLFPIFSHPLSELFAVLVWFGMVHWLMWRTRSIWDCVAAHIVTNFLLGIYVVAYGEWHLW